MELRDEYLEGLCDMGLTNEITEKMNLRFDYLEAVDDIRFGTMFIKKGLKLFPKSDEYLALEAYVIETINEKTGQYGLSLRGTGGILDKIFGFYVDHSDKFYGKSYALAFCDFFILLSNPFRSSPRLSSEIEYSIGDTIKIFNREIFSKLAGHVSIKGESRWYQEDPYIAPSRMHKKIKDKKDHVEFESGAVRDSQKGKGRMDLVPLDVAQKLLDMDSNVVSPGIELSLIEGFKDTNEVAYLYGALISFSRHFDDVATMILKVALHFEDCLDKYDQDNWKKGIPVWSFISSGSRHYLKWLRGDCDEHHELAFVWNMLCCIATVERGYCDEKSC